MDAVLDTLKNYIIIIIFFGGGEGGDAVLVTGYQELAIEFPLFPPWEYENENI